MKSPTNQPKKDPFHLYSLSPHLPQFQQSAGAIPLSEYDGEQILYAFALEYVQPIGWGGGGGGQIHRFKIE